MMICSTVNTLSGLGGERFYGNILLLFGGTKGDDDDDDGDGFDTDQSQEQSVVFVLFL